MDPVASTTALWWAVVLIGFYHGLNPGMGWPLAVSSALMERRTSALPAALLALGVGHFISMTLILLPFTMMTMLISWESTLRIAASCIVIAMGLYLFANRRHPRFLARVPPSRLALWSGLAALAHGAGLMLVPMYLGLCRADELDPGHQAAVALMAENLGTALLVAAVHTGAMMAAGAIIATVIYLWLGLRFLSRTWFNLDRVWAASLVLVGVFGLAGALSQA